jgi:hypothetical protein
MLGRQVSRLSAPPLSARSRLCAQPFRTRISQHSPRLRSVRHGFDHDCQTDQEDNHHCVIDV